MRTATVNGMCRYGETRSGFTVRSVAIALLSMVVIGLFIHFVCVVDATNSTRLLGSGPVSIPSLMVFIPVFFIAAGLSIATHRRFLTHAELLVILFSTLMAAPLMSHGFWRMMLSGVSTIARTSDFEKIMKGFYSNSIFT